MSASAMTKRTWLTPYLEIARRREWTPTTGHALKVLGRLRKRHGEQLTMASWREFCHQTPLRYLSLKSFEEKFGAWAPVRVAVQKVEDQLDLQMRQKESRLSWRDPGTGGEPEKLDLTKFLAEALRKR